VSGSSYDPAYDGGNLASRGDIVVVRFKYRPFNLGFLAIPGTNITGNYGIADQIVALQWIQQNIVGEQGASAGLLSLFIATACGGDPAYVMIFGRSAGAASVHALLASPRA
jgi:carboxylesterase type B